MNHRIVLLCIILSHPCAATQEHSFFKTSINKISSFFSDVLDFFKPRYYEKSHQKEVPTQSLNTLVIADSTGPVTITGWKKDTIYLTSTKYAKDLTTLKQVRTTMHKKDADSLLLVTQGPQSGKWSTTYDLLIPQHMSVVVTTNTHPIIVNDVRGTTTLTSVSGPITVNNNTGEARITTQKGTIDCNNNSGILIAQTHTGKITFNYDTGVPTGTIDAKTEKNIIMTMPATANATLKCSTNYGTIISEHYVTLDKQTTLLNRIAWSTLKKNIAGSLGNGETATISLHSDYGNISLLLPRENSK